MIGMAVVVVNPVVPSGPSIVRKSVGTGGIGSVAGDLVAHPSRPSEESSITGDRASVARAGPSSDGITVTRFDDTQTPDS